LMQSVSMVSFRLTPSYFFGVFYNVVGLFFLHVMFYM